MPSASFHASKETVPETTTAGSSEPPGDRVLLYAPLYPPYVGGAPVYFSTLADVLSASHRMTVLTSYHPDRPVVATEDGVAVWRVVPRVRSLPRPIRALLEVPVAFFACLFAVLVTRADLVHAHPTSLGSVGVAVATGVLRTPIVYDCRDALFPPRLVTIGATEWWFSCASSVDRYLVEHGVPESRIVRIPVVNPEVVGEVASERAVDSEPSDGPFEVIYVGALRRAKGVLLLIEAFEAFAADHGDAYLSIVGEGPDAPLVDEAIEARGIEDRVRRHGPVPHRRALELLSAADVLVLPSENEGVPRVLLEACEQAVPVVATAVGDVPETIRDGDTGLIVDRDPAALVEALDRLYADPALGRRLGRNCQEAMTSPDWETIAERVSSVYRSVAGGAHG